MKNILKQYRKLPEFVRMSLTAVIGVGIGFITYELIYYFNPITPKASSSWFMAYAIGIARQHALHRWLTFSHKTPYWKSLLRAYIMYSGSLVLSSILNFYLTEVLLLNHRLSWLICLIITALISFILLKKFVFKKNWR